MTAFSLYQATGLTPQELSEVLQQNPRAYMAVRGAVSEKHLEKGLRRLLDSEQIDGYRKASGDFDKDFYIRRGTTLTSVECKNVEVIKTSNKREKVAYIDYLFKQGDESNQLISTILREQDLSDTSFEEMSASDLSKILKQLPQRYRESGLVKYQYSASMLRHPQVGAVSDNEYIAQFNNVPLTIDFQRTRNSTDKDGDTRRNRYYRVGEIDIIAACLFSRTMEWRFLYAKAENLDRHKQYVNRYANRLKIEAGIWKSNLADLLAT